MMLVAKLVIMLAAGLLARHVTLHLGRALATRTRVRVPALCGYALAGCTAGLAKLALMSWAPISEVVIWVAFGTIWGVVAGLVLPLARRPAAHPVA
jgi:hypothetical protein